MDWWWIGAWIVGASVFLAIGKKILIGLAWRFFGWRPSILDKKLMEETVERCWIDYKDALEANPQWKDWDDGEKDLIEVRFREAADFAIQRYVLTYSMVK